jgi:hypothetical protein
MLPDAATLVEVQEKCRRIAHYSCVLLRLQAIQYSLPSTYSNPGQTLTVLLPHSVQFDSAACVIQSSMLLHVDCLSTREKGGPRQAMALHPSQHMWRSGRLGTWLGRQRPTCCKIWTATSTSLERVLSLLCKRDRGLEILHRLLSTDEYKAV